MIAALDIGTSKICCLIAESDGEDGLRVTGSGHQLSHGIRAGSIIDMDAAEAAIGNAVHQAEQMAGETIRQVVVNLSGGQPTSRTVTADIEVSGPEVNETDLRRGLAQASEVQTGPDTDVVHALPVSYTLDGNRGIRDPRGMMGDNLAIQVHLVSAAAGAMRNIVNCVERCHLTVESLVVSPYASGLSCLVEDEADLGATVIDMGGGTTSIAVFADGHMVFTDSIPVGGAHVTNDIARGLTTPITHAERMKTLYGHALGSAADEHEMITVPQVGEDDPAFANQVPKSLLVGIIQPRLEELFELVRSRLEINGFSKSAGRRVVLTGGASLLPGTRELAQAILDKQVRMGKPLRLSGLDEGAGSPAFATAAGLLSYARQRQGDLSAMNAKIAAPAGLLGRVNHWLRENL
jgi:cell division protein FtsA